MIKSKPNAISNPKTIPTIYIRPFCPHFIENIKVSCSKIGCNIKSDSNVAEDVVEISREIGFLIITPYNIPKHLSQVLTRIYTFLDTYSTPYIIFQNLSQIYEKFDKYFTQGLLGLFIKLYLEENAGVIPTRNALDTAYCLKSLAKRVQIIDNPPQIARVRLKSNNLYDDQIFLLEGLWDCGPKKAENLSQQATTPFQLIQKICNPKSGLEEVHGIGPKFMHNNQNLLKSEFSSNNSGEEGES